MKRSTFSVACVAAALLPLAATAGDKDKDMGTTSASSRQSFDKMDNDRDGRLSKLEAGSDSKLAFTSVDKNGDGYIDRMEYTHRDTASTSSESAVPSSQSPESSSPNSPDTSMKTDPNQQQATQPSSARPDEKKPQ
jgi:hypothetical protein